MKKAIRVCMLGSDLSVRGGMSTVVSQLLRHQWSRDVQIEYIPTHETGTLLHRCLIFARGYLRLRRLLKQGRADLVHLHMSQRGSFCRKYILYKLARRYQVPIILHLHGSEFMQYYAAAPERTRARIQELLLRCDRVLTLGRNWARNVRSIEPRARLRVLHNAVEIPQTQAVWTETGSELCYLGVLTPRKGVGDLLYALKLLTRSEPRPLHLTVAGTGEDQPRLEELCRELGLSDRVTFTGWIDDETKRQLLRNSQCFILPSYNEGLPVGILEALSYGVPTVSTNVGSTDEAVLDEKNGRLVQPGDPETLAEAIRYVTAGRETWERLSACARQTVRDGFDERYVFAQLEDIYTALLPEEP